METEKELDLTRSLQPRFLYFALKMSCLEGRESRVHNWFAVSKLLSLFTEAARAVIPSHPALQDGKSHPGDEPNPPATIRTKQSQRRGGT